MTVDEIRKRKAEARDQILDILVKLKNDTGLCPIGVNVQVLDVASVGFSVDRVVADVFIEMESV